MSEPRSRSGRRSGAAELAALASRAGADEALTSLIGQFADPLVFLRELVQNSLDAASTRIDVDFSFAEAEAGDVVTDAPAVESAGKRRGKGKGKGKAKKGRRRDGLMTITVSDNGEGMNEGIIDRYLLTLFSSTKEKDLTKIGKFGVGFVSIFAIEPELVVLETGQAGESWRLLFPADRSFEKLRLDEPCEGTQISLYKRVTRKEFVDLQARGRDTVAYWCKFAEAEILVDGKPISEDFAIDAELTVKHQAPGTELVLGFPKIGAGAAEALAGAESGSVAAQLRSLVGFYNRGLTLVEGAELPGDAHADLSGLSLRIKSRYLEHTLTRDNVRQDESYDKAIDLVRSQVEQVLRPRLVTHLEALAAHHSGVSTGADPGAPDLRTSLLYARLPAMSLGKNASRAAIIPTVEGEPVSMRELSKMKIPVGSVLSAPSSNALTRLLAERGVAVVRDLEGVVEHLRACDIAVMAADGMLHTAVPVEASAAAAALLVDVDKLLDRARARVKHLYLGDLDYPRSLVKGELYVRQEEPFGLTQPGRDDQPEFFGGARQLVVNSEHKLVKQCLIIAVHSPSLAAQLLAQSIAVAEDCARDRIVAMATSCMDAAVTRREAAGGEL